MRTGSLPLIAIGTVLVLLALLDGPWPADLLRPVANYTVSHQERLLGQDIPDGVPEVQQQRPEGYILFRVFDGLVYFALGQIIISTIALVITRSRFFLVLVMLASLYGAIYSLTMGLVVGPQMAFAGFSCIFFAAFISWITTGDSYGLYPAAEQRNSRHTGA